MIDELNELIPDSLTLQLGLGLSPKEFEVETNKLIENSFLKQKKITEDFDFATIYSRKLTSEVKNLVLSQFSDIDEKKVLTEIIGKSYSLPRRFNEEFKMTRYFTNIFVSEQELLNLNSFDIYHMGEKSDGIILNLIRTSKDITEIKQHFKKITDDNTIFKISKIVLKKNFLSLLKEYEAIKYLIQKNEDDEDILLELKGMQEEITSAIKDSYKFYYSSENLENYLYKSKEFSYLSNLSSILSNICEDIYCKTPIINNELINKQNISAPIKKARELVIEAILNGKDNIIKSKTSAEATIYKAIVEKYDRKSIAGVINLMKDFIKSSDNNKQSFEKLYNKLLHKPYGMRMGPIPILLAMALNNYSDNIILYYMNREIGLSSSNLVKINENPKNYYLMTEKGTIEKIEYLKGLSEMFVKIPQKSDGIRNMVVEIVSSMKKWLYGLPRIIRESSVEDSKNGILNEYLMVKKELLRPDLNNNEFLFNKIPSFFESSDKNKILNNLQQMKNNFEDYSNLLKNILIDNTKNALKTDHKETLSMILREFYNNLDKSVFETIFDIRTKEFLNYISKLDNYNEYEIINTLSKIFTDFYVEDWQMVKIDEYINNLNETISKIKSPSKENKTQDRIVFMNKNGKIEKAINTDEKVSIIGNTMKNNIEDIIEEYGESISTEEKINVLLSIMKNYL